MFTYILEYTEIRQPNSVNSVVPPGGFIHEDVFADFVCEFCGWFIVPLDRISFSSRIFQDWWRDVLR